MNKRFQHLLVSSGLSVALLIACGTASAQVVTVPYRDYQDGQRYDYRGDDRYDQDDRYDDRYRESSGARYDYAQVIRVDPVFDQGRRTASSNRCYSRDERYASGGRDGYYNGGYEDRGYSRGSYGRDDGYYGNGRYRDYSNGGSATARNVATIAGGVIGAVLGSKVGGGSGRYATSAIGSMIGGMAGREIYESNNRYRNTERGRVTVCEPDSSGNGYYSGNGSVTDYDVTYEYAGQRYTTRMDHHPGDRLRVRVDVSPQ